MKLLLRFSLLFLFTGYAVINAFSQSDTTKPVIKDGVYTGKSQSGYTAEPYWGIIKLTVKNGLITNINFMIRDSALHEKFTDAYAKHFEGNETYIQQTRNDWKGVNTYPAKLIEKQDLSKVDVISGATWSYNIFRSSVEQALAEVH